MAKVKLNDFTNQELINAIVQFFRDNEGVPGHELYLLVDSLEDGTWLNHINEKLKDE